MTRKLSDIHQGETALIQNVSELDSGLRLMEMGLVPGKFVKMINRAPWGDPLIVETGNTLIALRKSEANLVNVADSEEKA